MKQPDILRVPGEPTPQVLRRILNLAHLLLLVLLATWMLLFYMHGEPYDKTWRVVLLQLFFGRAAGVGAGLSMNFSPTFLLFQASMVDVILMLYVYPLFVRGYQHLTRVPFIGGYLAGVHKVALSHTKRMAPYGVVGLMTFVIFPFWSTGCLVGSVVGYLIGLPTWMSLSSVTAGNIVAIAIWVWFYERLRGWNETAALVLLIIIFALAIAGVVYSRMRRARKKEEEEEIKEYLEFVKTHVITDEEALHQEAPMPPTAEKDDDDETEQESSRGNNAPDNA